MKRDRFLRDLDNEEKYAMGLEMAYLDAFNAVMDVHNRMGRDKKDRDESLHCQYHDERHKELGHIVLVMGHVLRDAADRRKRLADVARGLSDVVFDEESP